MDILKSSRFRFFNSRKTYVYLKYKLENRILERQFFLIKYKRNEVDIIC